MDYHRQNNGWMTFLGHYWFLLIAISALVASQLLSFFTRFTGAPWIWCYGVALFAAAVGLALILYSQLPLYRQRRFLTFGSRALPVQRRPFYRWGYRCVALAIVLLVCLLLSRP